jgi:DNA mismatch repair protein MutS2
VVTALADKQGLYTIKAGILQTRVPESDLMLAEDALPTTSKKEKKRPSASGSAGKTSGMIRDFSTELDIRGMNGEDGWFTVDRYLDTAKMAGVHTVRIIHGKGTGALRKALWAIFQKDPRIASYRYGNYGEGDLGVTVIELK